MEATLNHKESNYKRDLLQQRKEMHEKLEEKDTEIIKQTSIKEAEVEEVYYFANARSLSPYL